jgi:hypothetical protein
MLLRTHTVARNDVGSNYVGRQGNSDWCTAEADEHVWAGPHTGAKLAFDVTVGIMEPNSNSHAARSGCSQSFLNVKAGPDKGFMKRERKSRGTKFYAISAGKHLCQSSEVTTSGGMGEAFQRQIWHPHWKRVEAEDAGMKISKWVSRKRNLGS